MFDTICSLPLSADLFAQAVHPDEPLVAVGLSSGHVATLKLPPVDEDARGSGVQAPGRRGSNGTDLIETAWRTKRHKGSCRCLAYSVDGKQLYSAGTDGIAKAADSETGKVTGKVVVPSNPSSSKEEVDAPTVVHALSPQTFLLATDSGALHIYDLRDPAPTLPIGKNKTAFINATPAQTHRPHTDYISSLSPIPASSTSASGYSKQWLSTGGTTLALTDLRRGVLVKSEDQEEILLSSLYVAGLAAKKGRGSSGEKALVGGGDGVITLWEKGQWDDQDERIIVSRENETLDIIAQIPDGVGGMGKKVAAGLGDGKVRFIELGANRIVGEVQHDEVEGVGGLVFDVGRRMISGGGQVVKVWSEAIEPEKDEEEEAEGFVPLKHGVESEDDEEFDGEDVAEQGQEDEKPYKRRKKRKKGKGPAGGSRLSFAGLD